MSTDVIEQVRRYLDYAAGQAAIEEAGTIQARATSSTRRWFGRGPLVAVLTAAVILAVSIPLWIVAPESEPAGTSLPEPLALGVNYVWPDGGLAGDAETAAVEFAQQVLGWMDPEVTADPEATSDGPVWVTIQNPGMEELSVLTIPIDDRHKALVQVGSSMGNNGPNEDGSGQWLGISSMARARTAVVHARFNDPDRVEVLAVDSDALANGRIEIAHNSPLASVIVIYYDAEGQAIAAKGGHYGTP